MAKPSVDEDIERLQQATRAAHEAVQELKDLRRELKQLRDSIPSTVQDLLAEAVSQGLSDYDKSLRDAIEQGTQAVFRRFDTIADILLGEDRRKSVPLIEYARKKANNG